MAVPSRNQELENRLLADPEDEATKLVYADWLLERNEHWGEVIVTQSTRGPDLTPLFEWDDPAAYQQGDYDRLPSGTLDSLDPQVLPELSDVETDFRKAVRRELFGPSNAAFRLRWRAGFIDKIFIPQGGTGDAVSWEMYGRIVEHRCCLLLREFAVGFIEPDSFGEQMWSQTFAIEALAQAAPPVLRRLVLGAWEEHDISWTATGDISLLYPVMPQLEVLELQGNGLHLGVMSLPELRRLVLRSGGLPREELDSLSTAELPSLEELVLWFGHEHYGGCASFDVAPFLDHKRWPKLRHLGLCNAMFTNEICGILPHAAILPQLETLDLSMGTMNDEGAKLLLRSKRRFVHLKRLDLRKNFLSPRMCKRVQGLCADVDVRFQDNRGWGRGRRYVTVAE